MYAWPYLLSAFSSGVPAQKDVDILQKAGASLTDFQKTELLEIVLARSRPGIEKVVVWLLAMIHELPNYLVEKVEEWMNSAQPDMRIRDRVQEIVCLKCRDDELVRRVANREAAFLGDGRVGDINLIPRRVPPKVDADDPFMKQVPAGAPSKKDGLKILIMSDFNIAGQLTRLMRALNKYTNHMARCVIYNDDYLNYDHDVLITDRQGASSQAAKEEAAELVQRADFFHIGRRLPEIPGTNWNKTISPRNAVFHYFGTHLRDNASEIARFHAETGFKAITAMEWTMYRVLPGSYYHIQPYMLEVDELPTAGLDFSGPLRICHAPSNANYRQVKRSDVILDVMDRVARENERVETVLIEGLSNEECLELKRSCHLHLVALRYGFGLNAIESAAMGLIPVAQLPNFARMGFVDTPVIHATPETLYEKVTGLLADERRMRQISTACRDWARREFDARTHVRKYWFLYDMIYHGLSVTYPEIFDDIGST
jgi:hypothetical protein